MNETIQLRWVGKWVPAPELGEGILKRGKVLQYRGRPTTPSGSTNLEYWGPWREVPMVEEGEGDKE